MRSLVCLFLVLTGGLSANLLAKDAVLYVGAYTKNTGNQSAEQGGIYGFRYNPETGEAKPMGAVANSPSPTFLVLHPSGKFIYAANEQAEGTVSAFAVDPVSGQLRLLNLQPTRGASPVHVDLYPDGRWLAVANYNSGSVAVFPVREDGSLGEIAAFVQQTGSSIHPTRQKSPHPHQVVFSGTQLLVPDLGLDRVLAYDFNAATGALTANAAASIEVAPGAGPRHLVVDRKREHLYLLTELSNRMIWFSKDGDRWREGGSLSTLAEDFKGRNVASGIDLHPSGKVLYASNPGAEDLVWYHVDPQTGALKTAGRIAARGKTPRHFALDPQARFLWVANQSGNIVRFRLDSTGATLTPNGDEMAVSAAACVLFVELP